jgi:8-oxo-dGTP diphosphatase
VSEGRPGSVGWWRAAYKAAWIVRSAVWFSPWPHLNGALTAVWVDRRILIVRNSYNNYCTLPGGRLNRGESYARAAARELKEETGISVEASQLETVRQERIRRPFGSSRVEIFKIDLPKVPSVVLDPVEIAEYRWCTLGETAGLTLFGPVRRYLQDADMR